MYWVVFWIFFLFLLLSFRSGEGNQGKYLYLIVALISFTVVQMWNVLIPLGIDFSDEVDQMWHNLVRKIIKARVEHVVCVIFSMNRNSMVISDGSRIF